MLDPWIIEEIRRREEEERQQERPRVELPLEAPVFPVPGPKGRPPEDGEERGVVIVDFSVS
jgi:hypothetical protein